MANKRISKKINKKTKRAKRTKTVAKKAGSLNYWQRRAIEKEIRIKHLSDDYLNSLKAVFERAEIGIISDIKRLEEDIGNTDNINPFLALQTIVPRSEAQVAFNEMNRVSKKEGISNKIPTAMNNLYVQGKLNRLKMMQLQIKHRLEALKQQELKGTTEHLKNVYKETYYETANEIYDEETGFSNVASTEDAEVFIDKSFETMNVEAVEEAIKEKWHGKTFSERITKNNDKFSEELQKIFVSGMAQGKSADSIAKTISARMNIRMNDAKRIVRTESNRYLSDATFKAYENAGIEEYIFVATLDYKTSELCQELDQKIFKVKERQIGLNCNPMHPNCRSTTAPYIHADIPTRVARGTDGKGYEVDGE